MMKHSRHAIFPAAALRALPVFLLFAGTNMKSSAAVALFDNLAAGSPNGYFGVTNSQWSCQAFSTTATDFVVSEVSLRLWNQSGTTGGYEIQIWDANGTAGRPGAMVGSAVHVGLAQDLGGPPSVLNITGLNVSLQASKTYFLVALGTSLTETGDPEFFSSPGFLAWDATNVNFTATYDTGDSGSSWYGPYSQNLYMKISTESVPEVSSITICALGIGLTMLRRKR